MRDNKEITAGVEQRIDALRAQNNRRKSWAYGIVAVASCALLVVGLALALPGIVPASAPEASGLYSAATLADTSTGGYVLIGVTGFVLGVAATLLCVKFAKKNRQKHG